VCDDDDEYNISVVNNDDVVEEGVFGEEDVFVVLDERDGGDSCDDAGDDAGDDSVDDDDG
jgi:hypothetical protein